MAHTCPSCGCYCTCCGDIDDLDFGEYLGCQCTCVEDVDYDSNDEDLDF